MYENATLRTRRISDGIPYVPSFSSLLYLVIIISVQLSNPFKIFVVLLLQIASENPFCQQNNFGLITLGYLEDKSGRRSASQPVVLLTIIHTFVKRNAQSKILVEVLLVQT
jgi:hypothetical protein